MTDAAPPGGRWRRIAWIGGGLLLLVAVLVLLALPLLGVRAEAEAARTQLTQARDALSEGETDVARTHIDRARGHVDEAEERVHGFGADVWRFVPVAGGVVRDARHLVSALGDATAVADMGVGLYPALAGEEATLIQDKRVDLGTLDTVLTVVGEAGALLVNARDSLEEVEAGAPFVGDSVAGARDAALEQVQPLAESYERMQPLFGRLPAAFGAEKKRRYVVAMLNQAEMRYSGGTPLALSMLTLDDGRIGLQQRADVSLGALHEWERVRGNRFHRDGPQRLGNSTFAPSWSVSGEELLRGWRAATGQRAHGVLAVDVEALARLLTITGPLEIPGYGEFTGDNLVMRVIGSYDLYDNVEHDQMNAALIPAFNDRLFSGTKVLEKLESLKRSAEGRHFALYFRDNDLQDGFAAAGFSGDLADSEDGPIGVFTQNTVASKVDVWHRHTVAHRIELAADGTAEVHTDVRIANDTPPYADPGEDPRIGYRTRWANMTVAFFLPEGTEVPRATVLGEELEPYVGRFRGRAFFYEHMVLEPGATGEVSADYRLPDAATVSDDGVLTYRLTLEPHALVNPQTVRVNLRVPDGYSVDSLPEGWTTGEDGELVFTVDALDTMPTFELVVRPG